MLWTMIVLQGLGRWRADLTLWLVIRRNIQPISLGQASGQAPE